MLFRTKLLKKKKFLNFSHFFLFCFFFLRLKIRSRVNFNELLIKRTKKTKKRKFELSNFRKTYYFLQTDLRSNIIIPPKLKTDLISFPKLLLNFFYKISAVNVPPIKKPQKIRARRNLLVRKNQWNLLRVNDLLISDLNFFIKNSFFLRATLLVRAMKPFIKRAKIKFRRAKKDKFPKWHKKFIKSLIFVDSRNTRVRYRSLSFSKINNNFGRVALKVPSESRIIPLYMSFFLNRRIRRAVMKKKFTIVKVKRRRKSRRKKSLARRKKKPKYIPYAFNKNKIVYLKTPRAAKLIVHKLLDTTRTRYLIRNTMSSNYLDFYKLFLLLHGHLLKHGAVLKRPALNPATLLNTLNNSSAFKFFLRRMLSLTFKRKKNNYYFTIINYFGEVFLSRSCGTIVKRLLQKRNKKLRTATYYFYSIIKSVSNRLKRKRRYVIHYFLKSSNLNMYNTKKIIRMFRSNRIRILKVKYVPNFSHGLPTKKKKIRRL